LIFCAINVQLASGHQDASRAVVVVTVESLGLDVKVDRVSDPPVCPAHPVLVDERGAFAVVPHPGHQVFRCRAAGCCEVVPGVAQVVEVQAVETEPAHQLWPSRHLVEVAAPQRAAILRSPRGKPCHWTCTVGWVNEHQDQGDDDGGGRSS
jgi:hypothetical protein